MYQFQGTNVIKMIILLPEHHSPSVPETSFASMTNLNTREMYLSSSSISKSKTPVFQFFSCKSEKCQFEGTNVIEIIILSVTSTSYSKYFKDIINDDLNTQRTVATVVDKTTISTKKFSVREIRFTRRFRRSGR